MLIAFGLSFGPAVSNGLGRFAYALILPAMRTDLGWSYSRAGWINTANALGYLVGALVALRSLRFGLRRMFAIGMLMTAAALFASGLVVDYTLMTLFRFAAGVGGAIALTGGGALAAELFANDRARAPNGIAVYFSGGGLGILLPGATLPWLFEARSAHVWNEAWLALGVLAFALCIPSLLAARQVPARPVLIKAVPWSKRPFILSLIGYFLFAMGSIVYMTFIVAWMSAHGAGAFQVSLVWAVLGLAIMLSPIPWRRPLREWPGGWPLSASLIMFALGAAVPLFGTSLPLMLLSAALVGGGFFITPAAVTAFAKASLPRDAWSSAIAFYTVVFAVGMPIGPVLAGAVADVTGSLFAGLAISVGVLFLGAIFSSQQRVISRAAENEVFR